MALTPEQTQALRLKRYQKVLDAIARWEAKQRRARNALRKLAKRRAYYLRLTGGDKPAPTERETAHRKANATAVRKGRATAKQLAVVRAVLAKATKTTPAERGHTDMLDALVRSAAKGRRGKGPAGASAS
jgi:hypothetical protein